MSKEVKTYTQLTKKEIQAYKEKMKKEVPDAMLNLVGNNSIKRIDSFMDYFMNEIVLTEVDKLIDVEYPECKEKIKFDGMSFNIYDTHSANSIEFGFICFDKNDSVNCFGFLNDAVLKVLYDDATNKEYIESSDIIIMNNAVDEQFRLLIPFNDIADILITLIKGFKEEILYVVRAMNEYINRVKSISYSIMNQTSNSHEFRLDVNANANRVTIRLKNQADEIIDYFDLMVNNYDKKDTNCSVMINADKYDNLAQSILYAIRNMADNLLF